MTETSPVLSPFRSKVGAGRLISLEADDSDGSSIRLADRYGRRAPGITKVRCGKTMKTNSLIATTWITFTGLTLLASAQVPEYAITRQTIDGGGVMRSAGDAYELSGTIGQPDAGVMTGDAYRLSGGFWFGLSAGDCDNDGLVTLYDLTTLSACLLGPSGGISAGSCSCNDVDRDGDITLNDYAQLQAGFTGQ